MSEMYSRKVLLRSRVSHTALLGIDRATMEPYGKLSMQSSNWMDDHRMRIYLASSVACQASMVLPRHKSVRHD